MFEDMDDGDDLESVCDPDDEMQKQPPLKRHKTKHEGMKCEILRILRLDCALIKNRFTVTN